MRSLVASLLALAFAAAALGQASKPQLDRRDRRNPELVVEAGGRLSTCDQMKFTPQGDYLLAVGDDKVVRVWRTAGGQFDDAGLPPLRWAIWREQRGAIYALDVSADGKRVAVAGYGAQSTAAAVLDRVSGRILHYTFPEIRPKDPKGEYYTDQVVAASPGRPVARRKDPASRNYYAVRAIAFAPKEGRRVAFGGGDGSVFLWDLDLAEKKPEEALRLLGRHEPARGEFNQIRLVQFQGDDGLLSVAEDGSVLRWDVTKVGADPREVLLVQPSKETSLHRAVLSPDCQWLAASVNVSNLVAVRSLDGKAEKDIRLAKGEFARSVAFSPDGKRLAVAVASLKAGTANFYLENDDRIVFYDLTGKAPAAAGPPHSYRADYLLFHPDPKRDLLAVAGGENHEVALWSRASPEKPLSVKQSAGACLWDVALSEDGKSLGWREQRDPDTRDVNARGKGPWRVFDLDNQGWPKAGGFKPAPQERAPGGWSVKATTDPYVWKAVDRDGNEYPLATRREQDLMPRCYAFAPPTGKKPLRLLIGHYYGVTEFELTPGKVRRSRLYTGHSGEVTALAVSADRQWFVSASNDQTVSAWNLDADWPSQNQLGARFKKVGRDLVVETVDALSPASEAGLVEKDKVILFAFDGKEVKGGPEAWLERLTDPDPGRELFFLVERDGKQLKLLTTVRQRPLWRFFPTRDREWVLWMWRHSFYRCSTNGDRLIGWHVNNPDPAREPTFYRAEQFRTVFDKKLVIATLVKKRDPAAALEQVLSRDDGLQPLRFDRMEPPAAELEPKVNRVAGQDLAVTLRANPRDDDFNANPDFELTRAELWVNDHRLKQWSDFAGWDKEGRGRRALAFVVPNDRLRVGKNTLTFQTFNRLGARVEAVAVVTCERKPVDPRLLAVPIGVNNYDGAKVPVRGPKLGSLRAARNDAEAVGKALDAQTKLYKERKIEFILDGQADRAKLLRALDDLAEDARAGKIGADDVLIVFVAGHGDFAVIPPKRKGDEPTSTFVFCCPKYDPDDKLNTGISSAVLADKLAALPCRKLLLLDACHSGEAASNPVRDLTPAGQGPIILAACDRSQQSYEDPDANHGLFTLALLEALNGNFKKELGDPYQDGVLDVEGLYQYAVRRMPSLLKELRLDEYAQAPVRFPEQPEPLPVARR